MAAVPGRTGRTARDATSLADEKYKCVDIGVETAIRLVGPSYVGKARPSNSGSRAVRPEIPTPARSERGPPGPPEEQALVGKRGASDES